MHLDASSFSTSVLEIYTEMRTIRTTHHVVPALMLSLLLGACGGGDGAAGAPGATGDYGASGPAGATGQATVRRAAKASKATR